MYFNSYIIKYTIKKFKVTRCTLMTAVVILYN